MGRPKGSKNRPKAPPPELAAAADWAKANGYAVAPARAPEPKAKIPDDFREFLKLVKIRSKESGKLITPVLNAEQEELLAAWEAGDAGGIKNILALKPRKIGITTLFAVLFAHKFLTCEDPVTLAVLANLDTTAAEVMRIIKTAIASLPRAMRPVLLTNQVQRISREHPETPGADGATIVVETSRGDDPLRGHTPFWLHVTEAAKCRNPDALRASAFGAVPVEAGGRIILESTPDHIGDLMHVEMSAARAGKDDRGWRTFFFAWHAHATYRTDAPGFEPTPEEQDLAEKYSLSLEQLAWRRSMRELIGWKRFCREFPADFEDAYATLEGQWFQSAQLEELQIIPVQEEGTVIITPAETRETYCAAVDCAAGVGGDATTCVILNARTKRPVALYRSTTAAPERGSEEIWILLLQYNSPLTLVEYNSYGIPYIRAFEALRARLYTERRHETDGLEESGEERYFVTNQKTRVEVLEDFRTHLLTGALPAIDSICLDEAKAARVGKDGQIIFPRSKKNGHGDVLFAYALALRCLQQVKLPPPPPAPSVLREQEMRRMSLPSPPGARY